MSKTTVYGYWNNAFFSASPDGEYVYYETRQHRDLALAKLRAGAIRNGLSKSASIHSIKPVTLRTDSCSKIEAAQENSREMESV